jgi:hypothetical protein
MKTISLINLEQLETIAQDTKKSFTYNKHTGKWAWYNRGEDENRDNWVRDFDTRFDALIDSVAPYIEDGALLEEYENG